MKSPKAEVRLEPILHAYLDDLARLGAYGRGKSGVIRRFIEDGIQAALERKVIEPRQVKDFSEPDEGDGEE